VHGYPALARLMEEKSPVEHGASNEAEIQPPAHVSEAKGPASRPDPLGHGSGDPVSHPTNLSGSALPVADGRIALAGAAGRPISMDHLPDRAGINDRAMRPLEPTETSRPSGRANIGGIPDPWTSRHGLMSSGSLPAPPTWARQVDAGPPPENDRAQARPIQTAAVPDHFVGQSGATRRGILAGFDQADIGTHDTGPQNAPWSGGPAAWGGPTSSDHPAMTGRPAGGATQPDLSRTNDLLQQILDEMRKDQKGFLPVVDRNYNKYLEY
jgi:hypothetical protein